MSTRKLLFKNTFWLGLMEVFSKITMFAVTISLVRYLGPTDFGTFNLTFSYVAIFMVLSDFGLNTIVTRDVAKNRDQTHQYLSNLLGLKITLSLIIAFLIIISLFVLPTSGTRVMILIVMLYSLVQNVSSVFTSIFTAWERMELVFLVRLIYFVGILISVLIVIAFKGNQLDIVTAYLITVLLSLIPCIFLIGKLGITVKISFDKTFCQELLRESIPFIGLAIVNTIYFNNDTLLIGKFSGSTQVGFYQSAYKILFAFQSINVINNAIFPRLNILVHEHQNANLLKLIKMITFLSIISLVPLVMLITTFRQPIVSLIYGHSYLPAATAMAVLLWSGVINYFRNFTSNLLFAKRRQHQVLVATTSGLIINLFINFFFIPKFGFIAASWSLLISELFILIYTVAI